MHILKCSPITDYMFEIDALAAAGLTDAEAKVYLALLQSGNSPAGAIVKKAGLHRATTYQVLQRLIEKGLVSSLISGKKRHFSAAEPRRLLDDISQRREALHQAIPWLEGIMAEGKEKQEVQVYSGVKGMRTVLDALLEDAGAGGEYLDFGVSGLFLDVMGPYWHIWQARKRKLRVRSRVIFNEDVKKTRPEVLQKYFGKCRFHSQKYASLTDTMICKNMVLLLIWSARPPIAVAIKNAANAQSYCNQFELMWKSASRA